MPPAHVHLDCEEAYFVLDGEVTFIVDDSELIKGREAFVLLPSGTSHTFGNRGAEPARVLVIHAPALDRYFAALEDLWRRPVPPTLEQEQSLMRRYGMHPA